MSEASPLEKIRAAFGSGDPAMVRAALNAIARHRLAAAAPLLQAFLRDEKDAELRYLANKVLNFLVNGLPKEAGAPPPGADESATSSAVFREVADSVKAVAGGTPLASPDPKTRLKAVMLLVQKPQAAGVEALCALAETEGDPYVRSALPMAMVRSGGKDILPLVVRHFLEDPHPRVRANAVEALASLQDLRAAPFLVKMVSDTDHRTRANAVVGLQKFSKGKVWKILQAMVESGQVWMRDSAAYALGRLKDPRGVSLLGRLLRDPFETVTLKARAALEIMADEGNSEAEFLLASVTDIPMEETWDSLIKLTAPSQDQGAVLPIGTGTEAAPSAPSEATEPDLDDSAPGMLGGLWTASAARAAMEDGSAGETPPSPAPAVYRLDAPDPQDRLAELSRALGDGTPQAAAALAGRLADETDEEILVALLDALAALADRSTADAIHPFIEHRSTEVLRAAIRTVHAFADQELDGWLIPLLKDRRAEIKAQAAIALQACPFADYMGALKELALEHKADRARLALDAAREIGNPLMVGILEILARHKDGAICSEAKAVLKDMAGRGRKAAQRVLDQLDGYE